MRSVWKSVMQSTVLSRTKIALHPGTIFLQEVYSFAIKLTFTDYAFFLFDDFARLLKIYAAHHFILV